MQLNQEPIADSNPGNGQSSHAAIFPRSLERMFQAGVIPMTLGLLRPAGYRRLRATADRPELEQSSLRVLIAGIVMVYLFWYAFRDGVITPNEYVVLNVSVLFFVFGLALMLRVLLTARPSVPRRYLAMIADNAVTTFCLMQMGEGGAVIIGVYLFITFGNGFRYGRRYLHACQGLGVIGFSSVLALSDFWSHHLAIGTGFLIGLVILPFYVGVLAERIENAKKRADEASQAKGRFVANVSHEMRTPLNGVIAMADILRETTLNESQREIVETMTTSAQLLLAQIEDVLDLSKIEAGRVHIEHKPFNLPRLLTSAVKVILPQARYKGLDVTTEISLSGVEWFVGDAHHLNQVVLNLLSNAVKFTERGRVALCASATGDGKDAQSIRIEVRDTGIGISPSKQSAIFEPFTQADDSVTRIYGGTGLGTTIARHLIGLMGGSIGVQSEPGEGSTFWIELRLATSEAQGLDLTDAVTANAKANSAVQALAAAHSSKIHRIRGAKILVAEDNPTNQRVAQLILESGSHNVTIVENGEAALDALENGAFDLALFDLSMPVVSGLQALKLYRFTAQKPVPVLILSANVTMEVMQECEQAGAAEFIPKPLRASHLLDAVERHLAPRPIAPSCEVKADERPKLEVVETPPVDVAVLNDLCQLSSDPTFISRLLTGFKSDANRLIAEISSALAERRYDALRDSAHALKGGAASVGANQLSQLARRLEKASADSLRMKTSQWIEELLRTSQYCLEVLDRYEHELQINGKAPIAPRVTS
jgi:two-component system sensor histidine kinase RpfC